MALPGPTRTLQFHVNTIRGQGCVDKLTHDLQALGNIEIEISLETKMVTATTLSDIDLDDFSKKIENTICSAGHQVGDLSSKRKQVHSLEITDFDFVANLENKYIFSTPISCDGCVSDLTSTLSQLSILSGFQVFKAQQKIAIVAPKSIAKDTLSKNIINELAAAGRQATLETEMDSNWFRNISDDEQELPDDDHDNKDNDNKDNDSHDPHKKRRRMSQTS